MTTFEPHECRIGDRRFFLRRVEADDAAAVLSLFVRVFGELPPAGWHDWKYGPTGLGGKAMGLWDEHGELVAHYAGFPRRLLWKGHPVAALQIGDVMVAPEVRGLLTRRGPFHRVCSAFFGQWVGNGKPFALAFGFPNQRAMRLGVMLGLYHDLGRIERVVWPSAAVRLPFGWRCEVLGDDGMPDIDRRIERAWERMSGENRHSILGERGAAYLRARFAGRPAMRYRFLAVSRRWFEGDAVAVVHESDGVLRWLDLVGPRAAWPAAIAAVRRFAADLGAVHVESWASRAVLADLLASGAQAAGTAAYFALAQVSHCPDDSLATAGRWLAGDTDFL